MKYIHNDIVKSFRVSILHCEEHIFEIQNLAKYLPPPSKKGDIFNQSYWRVHNREFTENEHWVKTKDSIPPYIQYEIEYKDNGYHYLPHEEWCDLLYNLEAKDNSTR